MSTFGERLSAAMLAAGYLSPEALAQRIGEPPGNVRAWLRMQRCLIFAEKVVTLGDVLDCSIRWLVRGNVSPVPRRRRWVITRAPRSVPVVRPRRQKMQP